MGQVPAAGPDRITALVARVIAAQGRDRQVHHLQAGRPAAGCPEGGVQRGQPPDHRLVQHSGGGDQDIDVAGGRMEASQGQRPAQVQADQLVAEGVTEPSRRPSTTLQVVGNALVGRSTAC